MALDEHSLRLAEAVEAALPRWVDRSVRRHLPDPGGHEREIIQAGAAAAADIGGRLRELLARDVDEQSTTPLSVIRDAVRYPASVLRHAGVPPVARDEFVMERFPDDEYGLSPATWSDLGDEVHEAGIVWGASKAHTHMQRHGSPQPGPADEPATYSEDEPPAPPAGRRASVVVAAYTPDLMDRSRISAALEGHQVRFVARPEALVGLAGIDTVIIDLSKRGVADVLDDIVAAGLRVIAYGAHVDTALLERARDAGCAHVLARSKVFTSLAELVES